MAPQHKAASSTAGQQQQELLQDVPPRNESNLQSSWNELGLQEEAEKTQLRKPRK